MRIIFQFEFRLPIRIVFRSVESWRWCVLFACVCLFEHLMTLDVMRFTPIQRQSKRLHCFELVEILCLSHKNAICGKSMDLKLRFYFYFCLVSK